MVTQSIAINQIRSLLLQLVAAGYRPTQAFLFGSVAKGTQHRYSDIDLALWDDRFTGCLYNAPQKKDQVLNFKR